MKFERSEESNSHGRETRYVFSTNLDEAQLMLSLLIKAQKYIPECETSVMLHNRISNMIKCFEFGFYAENKFGKNFIPKDTII